MDLYFCGVDKGRGPILAQIARMCEQNKVNSHMDVICLPDEKPVFDNISGVTIKDKNNVLKIRTEDILFLETFERKVIIHTNSQDYIVKMSMNKLEKELNNKGFFRCHTSYIVNLIKIEEIKKDYLLINKFTLPVSKHRMKNLKLRLTSLLGDLIC